MTDFLYKVEEKCVGVADSTSQIRVSAENIRGASKKLFRYLCNKYEDTLKMWPTNEKRVIKATFTRNGGELVITRINEY